jgi:hydrogenase maturation protein HypF
VKQPKKINLLLTGMAPEMKKRLQIIIHGAVQGVGFRPFIFNLAHRMNLHGYVQNNNSGVFIEVEGEAKELSSFLNFIQTEKPPNALIEGMFTEYHNARGFNGFEIKKSPHEDNAPSALILPDVAICKDCLKELFDENNRRYLYPFINCTNCGPRFSIIEALPYDRKNTSMKIFPMCPDCRSEYENPYDRRFHAQPNACSRCGPHVELWNNAGKVVLLNTEAIAETSELIKKGKIVALKGLGGFQLIADACNDNVISILRKRKKRDEKPFAIMFPGIEAVRDICLLSSIEENLLLSKESPIVLLRKKQGINDRVNPVSGLVAPGNPYLGVMLPYTPLHHLLLRYTGMPLVATSGNLSEEPMCTDEYEALETLKDIADCFLIHNRPVLRFVDDSVVRVVQGQVMILRRARGYAPLPVILKTSAPHKTVIAVGGQMKNTVAINVGSCCIISQHIGDLANAKAMEGFYKAVGDFQDVYGLKPELTACDLHPDYLSTRYAVNKSAKLIFVQHHMAHIASCMAENNIKGTVLGVAWDGTGYGQDKTVWGGEFFLTNGTDFKHFAQMRKFYLPEAERAALDARRSAIGVLFEIFGPELWEMELKLFRKFSENELEIFSAMLEKKLNCILTSSMGRLFDAASAITEISSDPLLKGRRQ